MSVIQITKAEAVRRQVDTAIRLWFHDGDPISIHTLGCAGLGILNELGKPLGETATRYNPTNFREETFKEWIKIVNESRDFLKHADRDPSATLSFKPVMNEYLLVDCTDTSLRVLGEQTPIMRIFWSYFTLHNPKYFDPATIEGFPFELRLLPKDQFFEECLPVFHTT